MQRTHALVMGGSFSGLLISRVLANHFDCVTVIERDRYPDQPVARQGVPHSRFPHTLMLRGQQILEELFPGLRAELITQGAIELDSLQDLAFFTAAGWAARSASDLILLSCSRDLLDWSIRRRLAAFSNVQFLTGASVSGLLSDRELPKIVGVSLHQHSAELDKAESGNAESSDVLYADLIVDASGKASRTPQWLRALGYESPRETKVNAFVGYVARLYQPPPNLTVDWKMLFIPTAPPQQHRGGALFPIEDDRWIVGLVGGDRDYPPTDEAGFLAFARSLPTPALADAIEQATPLSPIYAYYGNENRQRHYDQLRHLPARLLVVGHAACLLNPTYGQAMTVAAIEAVTVDQFFQQHSIADLDAQTFRLQKQLATAHQEAWSAATRMDYRYHSTQGKPMSATAQLGNWYWDQLMPLIADRASVHHQFLEVLHLLKPSIALFQPSILHQVLWRNLREDWRRLQRN